MTLTSGERGAVADAVWDEPLAPHNASGSAGAALAAAGSGGLDPELVAAIHGTARIVQTMQSERPVVRPHVSGNTIRIKRGYDYGPASGRVLALTSSDWPDLTGAIEVRLCERDAARTLVQPMTVVTAAATGDQTVRVDWTAAQTAALTPGLRHLRVAAQLSGGVWADLADVELRID